MIDTPMIKFTLPDGTGSIRFYSSQDVRLWLSLKRGTSTYVITGKYRLEDGQWTLMLYGHVDLSYTTKSGKRQTRYQSLSQRTRLWACDQLEEADVVGMIAAHPEYVAAGDAYNQYAFRYQFERKLELAQRRHQACESQVMQTRQACAKAQRLAAFHAKAVAAAERKLEEFGTVTVPELAVLNY